MAGARSSVISKSRGLALTTKSAATLERARPRRWCKEKRACQHGTKTGNTYAIPLVTFRLVQPAGESGAMTTGCCCCCCASVGVPDVVGSEVPVVAAAAAAAAAAAVISDSGCCDSTMAAVAVAVGDEDVGGSPLLQAIEQ